MKTLILGIGNSILRDDGVGPAVVRELKKNTLPPGVFLEITNQAGISLLDLFTGYDTLIVIDAVTTDSNPGDITWKRIEDLTTAPGEFSQHNLNILRMLEVGRQTGEKVPSEIFILAIVVRDVTGFGEFLTPEVEEAVPKAAAMVKRRVASLYNTGVTHVENK